MPLQRMNRLVQELKQFREREETQSFHSKGNPRHSKFKVQQPNIKELSS